MKRMACGMLLLVALLLTTPGAWASGVVFPDGSASEVFPVAGGNAFAFGNFEGDGDIFVQFADLDGNLLFTNIDGFPDALAYWFRATGTFDPDGLAIYDFLIDQGAGFFLVTQVAF